EGQTLPVAYRIEREKFAVSEIVDKIIYEFQTREWEGITLKLKENEYTKNSLPPREEIMALIKRSMERVGIDGMYLGKSNRQAIFSAFNTLLRKSSKSIVYDKAPNPVHSISTQDKEMETVSVSSLRQNTTVFYTDDFENEIVINDTLANLKEII